MNDTDRQAHWQNVYATKAEKEVSWFQENPTRSLDMIAATGISTDAGILDVVGGASRLVDCLLDKGFSRLAILDLSAKALEATKERLGRRGDGVDWIVADVATWNPSGTYDVWHDRAAFHFLTDPADRDAYIARLKKAVRSGGKSSSRRSLRTVPNGAAACRSRATIRQPSPPRSGPSLN